MKETIKAPKIARSITQFLTGKPKLSLLIFFLSLAILLPGLLSWKSKWTPKIWFADNHPNIVQLDTFEKQFGSDQAVGMGVFHPDGIFQEPVLKAIRSLTEDLWQVTDVVRVESLTNYNDIVGAEDEVIIQPILPEEFEFTEANVAALKDKVLKDQILPDFYVSRDATYSLLYGFVIPSIEREPNFQQIVEEARALAKKYEAQVPGLKISIVGEAAGNNAFREISAADNKKIVPFMMGFLFLLQLLLYRNLIIVAIPSILVSVTIAVTYGFMGHIGIVFNSMLAAIPGIMLAICVADSIHIITSFFHFRRIGNNSLKAIQNSLNKNFIPTFMTSITTALSFASIAFTEILPIHDLGILAFFGTMMAWIYTYLLIGPTIALLAPYFDKNLKVEKVHPETKDSTLHKILPFLYKQRITIVLIFTILTGVSTWISLKNEVNSDPIKYFNESVDVRAAYDFTSQKMNGLKGIELVIDSGVEGGVKDPVFLKRVESFKKYLIEVDPEITRVKGIVDIIKRMNKVLHGDKEEYYTIPDSREAIAQLLFLYSVGLPPGMDMNNLYTLDSRSLRLRIIWNIETSTEGDLKAQWLVKKAKEYELNAHTAGNVPIYLSMNTKVVYSFLNSLAMSLVMMMILLSIVFKDIKLAALSMIPNITPLLFGGAVMYMKGQYIDIGTSLVYAVSLGIAVDDTIHFVANYKVYRDSGLTPYQACEEIFKVTGKALVITTILLVVGFGSFIFADFVPNHSFGVLCSIILVMALANDIILLPALLLILDRQKTDVSFQLKTEAHS
ncbi:MAG: MMPL family transporter [Bdellovibrio sp.]